MHTVISEKWNSTWKIVKNSYIARHLWSARYFQIILTITVKSCPDVAKTCNNGNNFIENAARETEENVQCALYDSNPDHFWTNLSGTIKFCHCLHKTSLSTPVNCHLAFITQTVLNKLRRKQLPSRLLNICHFDTQCSFGHIHHSGLFCNF